MDNGVARGALPASVAPCWSLGAPPRCILTMQLSPTFQRALADRVTDEMLMKPAGDLSTDELVILMAVLEGPHADEIMARIDAITARRKRDASGSEDGTT